MEKTAKKTLADLQVTTVRNIRQPVGSLSGGQRQAVAVAKAVMLDAKLVIMDEPTAALGVSQTALVLDIIEQLASQGHRRAGDLAQPDRRVPGRRPDRRALPGAMVRAGRWPTTTPTDGALDDHRHRHPTGERRTAEHGGLSHDVREPRADPPTPGRADVRPDRPRRTRRPTCSPTTSATTLRIVGRRVRYGESGALPVIVGLIVIVIIFQVKNSLFLSAGNLVNLMAQSAFIITLGMAEIFVLLLGEIDLAAGYTGGLRRRRRARGCSPLGDPWWAAVLAGLAASAAYGALQGIIIAQLKLPSFVVTLAGQLGLSGVLLYLISATGSIGVGGVINLHNSVINDIENGYLSPTATWIVMIVIAVLAGAGHLLRRLPPPHGRPGRPAGVGHAAEGRRRSSSPRVVVAAVANINRGRLIVLEGMPWGVLGRARDPVPWTVLLGRTRFGRYIYAIGGNAEAARRAGINIVRIRTLAFMLCGLTAGMTGIIYASLPGVDLHRRQRRPERAVRRGGGGHRRHQPVRRARQDAARGARRPGGRRHLQRPGAARPVGGGPAHVDGAGAAGGGHRRPGHPARAQRRMIRSLPLRADSPANWLTAVVNASAGRRRSRQQKRLVR